MSRWLTLLLLLPAGCSFGRGYPSLLSSPNNQLTDEARSVRQTAPPDVPRELDKQLLPPYVVEPGDVLLVYPTNLDSPVRLPGDQPVLQDGSINLGEHGHVIVAGRTVPDIEELVRAVVEAKTKDAGFIAVRLVNRVSKVYYVLGEVNAPGAYTLAGRETVLDGLVTAGGLTERASRREIILSRPTAPHDCRIVLPVCIRNVVQLGDTATNYQLAPGDRIFVPAKSCWEGLCGDRNQCFSCGGPQTACPMAAGKCGSPASLGPPVVPPSVGEVKEPLP